MQTQGNQWRIIIAEQLN